MKNIYLLVSIFSFPSACYNPVVIRHCFCLVKSKQKTFPGSQAKGLFTSCLGPGRVIASYFSLSIELCMLYHQEKICSAVPSVLLPSFVTYLLDGGGGGGGGGRGQRAVARMVGVGRSGGVGRHAVYAPKFTLNLSIGKSLSSVTCKQ